MTEEFEHEGHRLRPIPGFPGYFVGDDGSVWSKWLFRQHIVGGTLHELSHVPNTRGYRIVGLWRDRKRHTKCVHRLVLIVFRGQPSNGQQSRHLNGNKSDNRLANLKWGTVQENVKDRRAHGTQVFGERVGSAKLTEKEVIAIRRKYALNGATLSRLAKEYGVCPYAIRKIVDRKTWRHVP